jgi:Bacterial Ig domain
VSASASDDVGVAGVQFLLDSSNLGNQIPSTTSTFQWNTITASIGTHTLAAIARDFSGNATTTQAFP